VKATDMDTCVDDWRAAGEETDPADRAVAEAGARLAYRESGLPEPEQVVWAASPREAVVAALRAAADERSVRREVRDVPWAAARARLRVELGAAGWAEHWAATGGRLWDGVWALAGRIRRGVLESPVDPSVPESALRMALLDAVHGQHDAPWLAALAGGQGGGARLAGVAQVARAGGWWWPYARTVVLAERPRELHRNESGQLHRADGPALSFADGFALHAWRGMPVPASFLDELAQLTPEDIARETNAELRRVKLEHYGYERYLADSGAQPRQRDETGTLWAIDMGMDETVLMVEVVNATPEPDGSRRTYWLRVPPHTRSAREGVAWTFGLAAEAYEPLVQT
jgi:uncharacterized protein DUF6745